VTTIAEPIAPASRGSWIRTLLLVVSLALFAWGTPGPWGNLWWMVPAAVTAALLTAWRWGAWAVLVPLGIFVVAMVTAGPFSIWVWWIPVAALTGTWMGLREEGGGLLAGERAWMLVPVLLLAAMLPWMAKYPALVNDLQGWLQRGDQELLQAAKQQRMPQWLLHVPGTPAEQAKTLEHSLAESASLRSRALPLLLPSVLFMWMAWLVAMGRTLASRLAAGLRWPRLSRSRLADWRFPDGAIWLLLAGMGLAVAGWQAWSTTAWTLLIVTGLGYCLQGVAVVESLLRSRGIPPSIVALTFVFVLLMAAPAFLLATVCVGVSDVWLDYRRIEAVPDGDSL
jgi:hypothetical protein